MKTLAIIIPVYNVEQYLLECLESLSAQSYGDFVVICVDDGSTDSSAQIITKYANRDSRFILLTQENQGIGAARNAGLRYVYAHLPEVGYIGFMDPDDAAGVDYYANLIYTLESKRAQMATTRDVCRFLDSSYDSAMFALRQPKTKGIVRKVTSKNIAHKIEAPRSVFTRALLQDLRFPINRFAEDVGFSVCAHALAGRVALSKSARYFYRVRSGSLTSKTHPPQEFFQVFGFVYEFFKKRGYLESYHLPTDLLRPNRFAQLDSSYLALLQDFLRSLELSPSVLEKNKPLKTALQAKSLEEFMARTRSFREWRADKFCLHLTKNRKTIILFGKRLLDTSASVRARSTLAAEPKQSIAIIAKDITEAGGGERVGVNLANAFVECGFRVRVISLFSSNNVPVYRLDSRAELLSLSLSRKPRAQHPANSISPNTHIIPPRHLSKLTKLWQKLLRPLLIYKVERVLRTYKPSIVLSNDGWYIPRAKLDSSAYWRLWHLNAPKHLSARKARNLAKFDTLVVLSSKELAIWRSYHKSVCVIPNFLPELPDSSRLANPSTKVVLSVGRLSGEKGFDRLLDIWEMVQDRAKDSSGLAQWQLHIVGSGDLQSELESKIAQKGLKESVRLVGFRQDMERVYLGASIYVMCSYFEGFGMALAEACSYGLAGIAFDIAAGPSDIIAQGESGYLIEDGDKQSFVNGLCLLMSDEAKRAEFGANARELMARNFSKEAIVPRWQELFSSYDSIARF
ncbi:glycosyltransferase [Helicobacter sp.]|uniref:glycosyltransferase n=1 Tax=Helicobacter sp. TaxID=218 RepID=UPI0025BCB6E5|nr:glycosyltransferase [Helicobacter sp.]